MHSNIGLEMSSLILSLYVMMGCNVTSKIGTKYGALNVKTIDYLISAWSKQRFMSRRSRESRVVSC